ncbi:MAG: hypothetical protein LDL33_15865 [Desulfomonile sp.]|nr:hypothetical protein [Desulfomonile sp.]
MKHLSRPEEIETLVRRCFHVAEGMAGRLAPFTRTWIEKAFGLLPDAAADLFISGRRDLTVLLTPDPGLPLGMKVSSEGPTDARRYTITIFEELQELPEDLFIASFLRQLALVSEEIPPEEDWPAQRSQRSRMRELLEARADALVWDWGLKDQNLRFLEATYPPYIVKDIIASIEDVRSGERRPVEH